MFEEFSLIVDCALQVWRFQLGDNQPLGWTITAGYGLAAVIAWMTATGASFPAASRRSERAFWVFLAIFLAFMCVNKQLEFHTYITNTGRCVARAEGWFGQRREVQAQFLMLVAAIVALLLGTVLFWLRRAILRNWLAVIGLVVLFSFILLRAVSLTHVDQFFRIEFVEIRAHRYVELGGTALIIVAALMHFRRRNDRS